MKKRTYDKAFYQKLWGLMIPIVLQNLMLALADTAGHEVAWFSKAWHNGLPLAAALFTVNEAVCRVYVLVP